MRLNYDILNYSLDLEKYQIRLCKRNFHTD